MDSIFKALNDPARRKLLDCLRQKDGQTLSDLEVQFDMTRFGVMKHLGLLEEANLITTKKVGRFKHHYLNAVPLQEVIDRWIEPLIAKPLARGMIDLKTNLEGNRSMLDTDMKPDFVHQTVIRCSQDVLWDALTKADQVAKYHFMAVDAKGDFSDGAAMDMLRADGSMMLRQTVIKLTPKTKIDTSFEPNFMEGGEQPHSRIVMEIIPEGDHCVLTCEHYDIPEGQDGVREGWARHIASLKSWIETGEAIRAGMGS